MEKLSKALYTGCGQGGRSLSTPHIWIYCIKPKTLMFYNRIPKKLIWNICLARVNADELEYKRHWKQKTTFNLPKEMNTLPSLPNGNAHLPIHTLPSGSTVATLPAVF